MLRLNRDAVVQRTVATMKLMQWPSARTFVGGTLLASVVALILGVAWATTGAGAQGACETQGDLRPQLGAPAAISGSWSSSDCRAPWRRASYLDRYRLHISQNALVTIDLTSRVDTWLRLVGTDGRVIGDNDDVNYPSNRNSQISRVLRSGTYYVEASTFYSQDTGTYELRVRAGGTSSIRGRCEITGLLRLAGASTRGTGEWTSSDCRSDWTGRVHSDRWRLEVARGAWVTIDLTSGTDTFLTLFGEDGRLIEDDDDGGQGYDSRISRQLDAGVYYIEASTYRAEVRDTYEIRVSVAAECTPNDIQAIQVPSVRSDFLASDDCRAPEDLDDYADIYRFELSAESRVTIDLTSDAFDTYLRLLDYRADEITHDDDSGSGRDSQITETLRAGVYQIVATSYWAGATGAYELRIAVDELRVAEEWPENAYGGEIHDPCSSRRSEPYWKDDSELAQRAKILITRVLFQIALNENVALCTTSDYNDFGAPRPWADQEGYEGGHAGWDVQTANVYGDGTKNVPFYSLTTGRVCHTDPLGGAVGVYDENAGDIGVTVYYLHARHIYVNRGQPVTVDQRLGIQGDMGVRGMEHVHIEVHAGPPPGGCSGNHHHSFAGATNTTTEPEEDGTGGPLLEWHEQLNYLCNASASSALRPSPATCPPLTADNVLQR